MSGILWIPGATRIPARHGGGSMGGGEPRATWHTTENRYVTTARNIAAYLNSVGYEVHIVWNPETGELVQMLPANQSGRGLRNLGGGHETNRQGRVNIQIEVVGRAAHPFTEDTPLKGGAGIIELLRSWGIPDAWPAGSPMPYPASYGDNGDRGAWRHGGHFGHSQVPENKHGDPGQVNTGKLLAMAGKYVPPSKPRPVPRAAPKFPLPKSHFYGVESSSAYGHSGYWPADRPGIATWQRRMRDRGWNIGVDGLFGPKSHDVAQALQKQEKIAADGKVGGGTWPLAWTAKVK